MLSLRSSGTCCKAPVAQRRAGAASRRLVVPVRAGLGEAMQNVGAAFMRIFSPPNDNAPNGNWSGTTSAFTGKINHHEGGGRPFKDGFDGAKGGAEAATAAGEAAQGAANETADYMGGAIKSVMDANFASKDDNQLTTGAEGWKGDLHGRKKDGFHQPRM